MIRLIALLVLLAGPVFAVQPDEVLDDPALEARAREISAGLRCPVCQNENIDDSNATVSRDLRLRVRERLLAGDTNEEVVDYLVYGKPGEFAGFGEFILLRPEAEGANLVLWLAGPLALILAGFAGWATIRSRRSAGAATDLTEAEKSRLQEILKS